MKFILFGMALTIAQLSLAVRDVRGGGGLAEMQTVYLHQNLDQYIRVCLTEKNLCELNSAQTQEYQYLYTNNKLEAQKYPLVFIGPNPRNKPYYFENNQIQIPSSSLYDKSSEPYEIKVLLARILAIRLDMHQSRMTLNENYHKALQIFSNIQQQHQFHRVMGLTKLIMVHDYDIRFNNYADKKFFIEDETGTYDISGLVIKQLPCGEVADWLSQNWKSQIVSNEIYFTVDMTSACLGPDKRQAKLIVWFTLSPKQTLIPGTVRTSIRY